MAISSSPAATGIRASPIIALWPTCWAARSRGSTGFGSRSPVPIGRHTESDSDPGSLTFSSPTRWLWMLKPRPPPGQASSAWRGGDGGGGATRRRTFLISRPLSQGEGAAMARAIYLLFGFLSYLVFFATFLYLIAFVGNHPGIPSTVDRGP